MTHRHVVGMLLIGVSLVGIGAAFLALPVAFHFGPGFGLFLSRSSPVFWLVAVGALILAVRLSAVSHDKVGSVLGVTGVCLVASYLVTRHIVPPSAGEPTASSVAGLSRFVLAPVAACAFGVVTTVLGWHLVMPQRPGRDRSGDV